jgi:hypothetical protein
MISSGDERRGSWRPEMVVGDYGSVGRGAGRCLSPDPIIHKGHLAPRGGCGPPAVHADRLPRRPRPNGPMPARDDAPLWTCGRRRTLARRGDGPVVGAGRPVGRHADQAESARSPSWTADGRRARRSLWAPRPAPAAVSRQHKAGRVPCGQQAREVGQRVGARAESPDRTGAWVRPVVVRVGPSCGRGRVLDAYRYLGRVNGHAA